MTAKEFDDDWPGANSDCVI
jgi:hypothetical protein